MTLKAERIWVPVLPLTQTTCMSTETCEGRCGSFNPEKKCQCDSMCLYYGSCCDDFATICPKKGQCSSSFLFHCCPDESWLLPLTLTTPSAPSCSWWRLWGSWLDDDRPADDQHGCSNRPNPCCTHTWAHNIRRPQLNGLQRPTFWCISAAEEWVHLRV